MTRHLSSAKLIFVSFGVTLGALASVPSVAHAAPEEDPFVAMCKRDAKNLLGAVERAKPKTGRPLAAEYRTVSERMTKFQGTCISGPKVAAVKSSPGYAEVTKAGAKIKAEVDAIKARVDADAKANQEASRKKTEDALRRREEEQRRESERLAAIRAEEAKAAAAREAEEAAYRRALLEEKARERCTQNGKLSKPCFTFITDLDVIGDTSKHVEYHGTLRTCFNTMANAKGPQVSAAGALLEANASSEYALECMRMMDVAVPGWRAPYEKMMKYKAFVAEVSTAMENFGKTCGVSGWLESPTSLQVVLSKKSSSKKIFLKKKNPDGELFTIYCSGVIVTKDPSGGSMTSQPKTLAEKAAHNKLRECAMEKAKLVCPGGKNEFMSGKASCVRAAEAACK